MPDSSPPPKPALPPWPTVSRGVRHDHRVFAVEEIRRRSPRTGGVCDFRLLHMPDWVNVIALTADGNVVLVEQFRHGIDSVTFEIPGGMVDPGEDPSEAAIRELAEETGYGGNEPESIGWVHPNPALQTNRCSTWLIRDARYRQPPRPDDGEQLRVVEVPSGEIGSWIEDGRITHALVIVALQRWWQRHPELAADGSIESRD